jgi:hypothetical protein
MPKKVQRHSLVNRHWRENSGRNRTDTGRGGDSMLGNRRAELRTGRTEPKGQGLSESTGKALNLATQRRNPIAGAASTVIITELFSNPASVPPVPCRSASQNHRPGAVPFPIPRRFALLSGRKMSPPAALDTKTRLRSFVLVLYPATSAMNHHSASVGKIGISRVTKRGKVAR